MQSSVYNNPAFAQGVSGLLQSFMGDPASVAQAELYASEALLNNQTAQYREAMDVGLDGDIASMMIRALQAGPDYSRYAPTIGQAWYDATSGRMARGPIRGGGGGGTATPSGEPLGFRTVNAMRDALSGMDIPPATMATILAEAEDLRSKGMSDAEVEDYVLNNLKRGEGKDYSGFWNFLGWEDQPGEVTGVVPYQPSGAGDTGTKGKMPGSGTPRINTEEELAGLPAGSQFIAPDGKVYIK